MQIDFYILNESLQFLQIVHCKVQILSHVFCLIVASLVKLLLNVEHFLLKSDCAIACKDNFMGELLDKVRFSSFLYSLLQSIDLAFFLMNIILKQLNHLSWLVYFLNHQLCFFDHFQLFFLKWFDLMLEFNQFMIIFLHQMSILELCAF